MQCSEDETGVLAEAEAALYGLQNERMSWIGIQLIGFNERVTEASLNASVSSFYWVSPFNICLSLIYT